MVAPVISQTPDVTPRGRKVIPFRRATVERTDQLPTLSGSVTAGQQPNINDIQGDGFFYGVTLDMQAVAATNVATVAFQEDAPYSALASIVLKDVNGELWNTDGYSAFLQNLAAKNYDGKGPDQSALVTTTSGTPAAGGSFKFFLDINTATNRRDLLGIVGNQDRSQKYQLRTDIAASASIYSTAPTNAAAYTLDRFYENYSAPLATSPDNAPQETLPTNYGSLHFVTQSVSDSAPAGGSTINHYLQRIGNTIRFMILVFRANGSRATAETNAPTNIRLKVGNDTLLTESYRLRRKKMYMRYGFDWPNGVLVYDNIHDFQSGAGMELGDDYYHTKALTNAQFIISYPSGFGSTNNSLTIITDDLIMNGG